MNILRKFVSRNKKSSDKESSLEYFIMAFILKEYSVQNLLMSQYKIHQDEFETFDEFKAWMLNKYEKVLPLELKENLK